jgi:ATP-dependent RNA/DNA helicase IGHMBP2
MQDSRIQYLLENQKLEFQAQQDRFRFESNENTKFLQAQGVLLFHLKITHKRYGFADYPECTIRLFPHQNGDQFKGGSPVELFYKQEKRIQGIVLNNDEKNIEFRFFTSEFPDWMEEKEAGIHLVPDSKTNDAVVAVLQEMEQEKSALNRRFFNFLHYQKELNIAENIPLSPWGNEKLNESQQAAVREILSENPVSLVHGPPGTGKTTTLCEAIYQLKKAGKKVIVTATGNAAVDHISKELIARGVNVLRVGNSSKIHPEIIPFTIEGKMNEGNEQLQLKKMHIQANQLRKMAQQYKRNFGKDERDQRKLLLQEVKNIRREIKKLIDYFTEKWIDSCDVLCGTPVALYDVCKNDLEAYTLIIDEAGQCLESYCWLALKNVQKLVLAGDHKQLPPTVLSDQAQKNGFSTSVLELFVAQTKAPSVLLDTQYRMREDIASFSNAYFYEGKLKTPVSLQNQGEHLVFYDTVGTGYQEEHATENTSICNTGELDLVEKIIADLSGNIVFISPYSGQIAAAKERFPAIRCSTIDSFQGQESEIVILSLVRSNDEMKIGFLSDYRRMNVAMTRAKEKLIVVGDSLTIGNDPFFAKFIQFTEERNAYRSAWELM